MFWILLSKARVCFEMFIIDTMKKKVFFLDLFDASSCKFSLK